MPKLKKRPNFLVMMDGQTDPNYRKTSLLKLTASINGYFVFEYANY